jgi:hypothetical protein
MNGRARTYVHCGLRVRSELDLALPPSPQAGWDVDVRLGPDLADLSTVISGEEIAAFEAPNGYWYSAKQSPDGYHVRVSDCGEFIISTDLSEVVVRRGDPQHAALLPIIMAGTVVTILLRLRGETVLHASAVSIDGGALAFVGQSGRGKSTVAALLCLSGFELFTDDLLVVRPGPPPTCLGGATELRLREAAFAIARDQPSADTRRTADDRLALASAGALQEELPLAAIVIPSPSRTATDIHVDLLPPSDALIVILAIPRLYGWKRSVEISRDFSVLSRLFNDVPVYHATIPWGPPFDPSIAPALARLATRESPSPVG